MNFRSTVWLVALALGLLAFIYFIDLRLGRQSEPSQAGARLFPQLDPASVTGVEISRTNRVIRAELVNDQWQLTNPPYPAQSTGIENLLQALTTLGRQHEIPAQEIISRSGGLSPFGLDPPVATVTLQGPTNLVQLRVGSRTLIGDRVYVQPVGASGIYMVDASLLQSLPQTDEPWRDPMLVQPSNLAFDRISITAGSRSFKIERDRTNQTWRLTEPAPRRADFRRVEYLIQQLRNARVSQFVSDDPKADLETFGLQTPESEVALSLGTNSVFRLQFGRASTNHPALVHARSLARTNVIVLVPQKLAELFKHPYTDFRDQTLLTFRPSAVDLIEVHAKESFAVQRHSNEWRIVAPFQAPADKQLMDLFLKDLGTLEIVKFERDAVADFSPYGLVKPQRQYILKTTVTNGNASTNQVLLQADFGSSPTNDLGLIEGDKVFCRRSDELSVYVVRSSEMVGLRAAAYELRDRHVWSFAASNVVGVTIQQNGQKRELARDPATGAWDKNDVIRSAAIEETLHRLGGLEVDSWATKGEEQAKLLGTAESTYQITVDLKEPSGPRQLQLSFGKQAAIGQPYAAVVLEQGQPVIFRFPPNLYLALLQNLSIPSSSTENP